jgi:hypothetical protein
MKTVFTRPARHPSNKTNEIFPGNQHGIPQTKKMCSSNKTNRFRQPARHPPDKKKLVAQTKKIFSANQHGIPLNGNAVEKAGFEGEMGELQKTHLWNADWKFEEEHEKGILQKNLYV